MYFVAELHSPISSVPRITITSVGSILPASCLSMAAPAITWQITSGQQWFCLLLMQEQKPVTTALVTCSLTNKAHHIDHVGCLASQTWMWWSQEKERKRKGWRWACKQHIHFFLQNQDCPVSHWHAPEAWEKDVRFYYKKVWQLWEQ